METSSNDLRWRISSASVRSLLDLASDQELANVIAAELLQVADRGGEAQRTLAILAHRFQSLVLGRRIVLIAGRFCPCRPARALRSSRSASFGHTCRFIEATGTAENRAAGTPRQALAGQRPQRRRPRNRAAGTHQAAVDLLVNMSRITDRQLPPSENPLPEAIDPRRCSSSPRRNSSGFWRASKLPLFIPFFWSAPRSAG